MALFENFMEPCVRIDKKTVDDGQGGYDTVWTEGARFRAAVIKEKTIAARVAEKEGVTEVYTVTTEPGAKLDFHDVFKRLSDGLIFRVTSNARDGETPTVASFAFEQVNAERWKLT